MKRKPSRLEQRRRWKQTADKGFAAFIRSVGVCQAAGLDDVKCNGMLQCAHVETRNHHALRWSELNAICLCAGHHRHYGIRPIAWVMFIAEHFPEHHAYVTAHINDQWDRDLEAVALKWGSYARTT